MYTAYADYCEDGKQTLCVMYSKLQDLVLLKKKFELYFGNFMGEKVEIYKGMRFDLPSMDLLISERLKMALENWEKSSGGLEYTASLHVS